MIKINTISSYILSVILKNTTCNEIERLKVKLGIDILLLNIPKILILYIISAYLGMLQYTIIISIVFGVLRSTSFGTHANSSIKCFFVTAFIYIGEVYIANLFIFTRFSYLLLLIFMAIFFYKYAPADTEKHPLLNAKLRKKLKLKTIFILLILLIIGLITNSFYFRSLIILATLSQLILILPLTYKLLNRRYNNYANYNI
ncbi:accessory gene regulator B family protein [Clostridium sp. YIM B02505]|uniref:Putative AgrB-like protein n=1 Tax=Clostridium yunnanense TaxID=2800325 RepID=A0ABS1ERH3_9CLOT|nr:accessory gene regulator B family protein [Clostridium yunnanense]